MGLQKFLKDRFEVNLYPMSNKLPTEKKTSEINLYTKVLEGQVKK